MRFVRRFWETGRLVARPRGCHIEPARVDRRRAAMSNAPLGRLLGAGKEAGVFEYGAMVVKLYKTTAPKRSAFREASTLALVESFGLPAPRVHGVRQFG